MPGEYEPNDSRNVTGTGASKDGRWTNQDGKTPNAAGQPQQSGSQSGQQGGMSGSDAGGVSFEPDPALRQEVQQDTTRGQQGGTFTGPSGGQAGNSQAGFGETQQSGANPEGAGYAESGQQSQFERPSGQMGGGTDTARFAEQIREDMKVCGPDGEQIGTVDSCEGDRIKLTRADSPDGQHHFVPLSQVEGIEGDTVRLRTRGDTDFGMNAE